MMSVSVEEFNKWLLSPEDHSLEFKEAKSQFNYKHDISDYCAALANEGGGKLILGVSNKGKVVGSQAFMGTFNKISNQLLSKLGIRIDIEELIHPEGRVLIFYIPSHHIGQPVKSDGKYWMRAGESLTTMDVHTLRQKLTEGQSDFSAQIVRALKVEDIDDIAVNNFKVRWSQKALREEYLAFSTERILRAIGVLSEKGLNYAALILFGKKEKIDELLAGSEIIFEWRQDVVKTSHDFRINWREPFFKVYDEIWNTINSRNLRVPFQEGLFQREVYAFNEKAVREALNNAVTHRDYSINSRSIFIKASPQEFFIESPGTFPPGITTDNILDKSSWRNRCIAEVFEKAQLVERAGQGMNDIFESSIREGKGLPDFSGSDKFSVALRIPAQVKDQNFIIFLEKVAKDKQILLSFEEIYELEKIREFQKIADIKYRDKFLKMGLIEKIGKTNDSRYILSHRYYAYEGKPGVHTRLTDIPREKRKELIIRHLEKNKRGRLSDFNDIFPEMKSMDISNILRELKQAKKIVHVGNRRQGYWQLL